MQSQSGMTMGACAVVILEGIGRLEGQSKGFVEEEEQGRVQGSSPPTVRLRVLHNCTAAC